MRLNQYYAWDKDGTKITGSHPDSLYLNDHRVTAVYHEQEVYNVATKQWDIEVTKVLEDPAYAPQG